MQILFTRIYNSTEITKTTHRNSTKTSCRSELNSSSSCCEYKHQKRQLTKFQLKWNISMITFQISKYTLNSFLLFNVARITFFYNPFYYYSYQVQRWYCHHQQLRTFLNPSHLNLNHLNLSLLYLSHPYIYVKYDEKYLCLIIM